MKRLLISVFLVFVGFSSAAKTVRLITIGPGDAFWSAFGHTAIAIDDEVYGFGYFSFDLDIIKSFVSNSMMYELGVSEINYEANLAEQQNRTFSYIDLELSEEQTSQLADFLDWHYLPENQTYRYDYFLNNCSTKIRDLLILAWPNDFEQNSQELTDSSYFEQTFPAKHQGLMNLGLAVGYGWEAYQQRNHWELMAFPVYLEQQVVKMAAEKTTHRQVVYETIPSRSMEYLIKTHWALIAYVLFWILILMPRSNQVATKSWFIWHGLIGWGLMGLWFLTPHSAADWNVNVLLFSPFGLFILFSEKSKHFIYPGWVLWLLFSVYLNAWYLIPMLLPAFMAMRNLSADRQSTVKAQ